MAKTVENVVLPSYPRAMCDWELRLCQDKPPTARGVLRVADHRTRTGHAAGPVIGHARLANGHPVWCGR